ncbi:MAG TPA: tRNA (N(6)-L-threonylcarbamoyladenosine(37)-C(2))-methylthiotransferase MtaB [Paludibacteraceae bacterium]|nr:tRNA (N(6)-L-threonylcarbamoyladenosine(37)-C(2))-methylthiotransferase MtaB [Paludibacteraceae bacterium]
MIDTNIYKTKKAAYYTLGCKLNFAETSQLGKQLSAAGYRKVHAGEEADVCIVNTCSVTDTADHKCRQAIKRLKRQHPNAIMVVTGCYAQLNPEEIAAIDGVNLVLGAGEKFDVVNFIEQWNAENSVEIHKTPIQKVKEFHPSCSGTDRTRYFLKVQDGCDYYCTYCTIPFARGRSRNASIRETVELATKAVAEGAKEIVLSGVNIGDFGKSTGENFFDLVRALDTLPEEVRFRISSIEPDLLTDELIEYIASSHHFMPHFHIPLQAGSNEALLLMKRRYSTELFAHKVEVIKKWLPDAFIGVDVIVGTRGETEELFEKSKNFIASLDISQLHVFTYSEREGTKMIQMEQNVPLAERKRRSDELHLLSEQKTQLFYESQMGKEAEVLWEGRHNGSKMVGFTANYIRVERPYEKKKVNTIEKIKLGGWNDQHSALIALGYHD